MRGSRGGRQGVRTPLKNHKNKGFLSNTGPDPLKMTKLPNQHSMSDHHRHAIIGPLIVYLDPQNKKKNIAKLLPHCQNFLDQRMFRLKGCWLALCCVFENDTLPSAKYWFKTRKPPNMTDKLLAWM